MAVAQNRYYNDPTIGQAFSNLAGMFAPPSGGDLAGYATAAAKKAEAARLAQLFDYAKAPDFNQTQFDRMGVAVGNYAPTGSYYAVDQNNATTRRGQDIDAETSRLNNANTVRGSTLSSLFQPLNQGQLRPEVPEDIASTIGLPAMSAAEGLPKPLSETEVKGAILRGLPATDQQASVLGDIPLETITGDNGQGQFVRRPDAVGKQPYEKTASETVKNYKAPDGKVGTAVMRGGQLVDTQTNAPVPAGSQVFSSSLQGGSSETGLGPTTANATDWNKQAMEASYAIQRVDAFQKLLENNPGALGIAGSIQDVIQSAQQGLTDVVNIYGENDIIKNVEDLTSKVAQASKAQGWDPAIYQARLMALEMAYMEIKSQDPSGEVNVRELERVLPLFNGGIAGNRPVLDALQITKQRWQNREAAALEALKRTQAPAAGAPASDAGAEEWDYDASGKLVRVR